MWWVIAYTALGNATRYQYFEGTQAQAQQQANLAVKVGGSNITGPYASKADAEAAVKAGKVNKGDQSTAQQAQSDVSSSLGTLTDIPKYIAAAAEWIGNRGNWLRIMKVIIGGGLILMGIHHISAVQAVTSTARKVAETAAIA